jgi:hypothetical protein
VTGIGRPGRPSPHLISWPGQAVVVIPAADFAELAVWLAALIDALEGRERPGSVRQVAVTTRLREYAGFLDRAAAAVSRAGPLGPQSATLAGDGLSRHPGRRMRSGSARAASLSAGRRSACAS